MGRVDSPSLLPDTAIDSLEEYTDLLSQGSLVEQLKNDMDIFNAENKGEQRTSPVKRALFHSPAERPTELDASKRRPIPGGSATAAGSSASGVQNDLHHLFLLVVVVVMLLLLLSWPHWDRITQRPWIVSHASILSSASWTNGLRDSKNAQIFLRTN